jgi:hypothetical protein
MIGGTWRFLVPDEGWLLFDQSLGGFVIFRSQWHPAAVVPAPSGGTTIDGEARAVLTALIDTLTSMGLLAAPAG